MKSPYFFISIIFLSIMFSSCFSKVERKEIIHNNSLFKKQDALSSTNEPYIDIIMENDTLEKEKQKGIIKFFFKIDDSIKLSSKDERSISVILALGPLEKNKKQIKPGEKVEKELVFTPVNKNDTIKIPFTVTPHFSGKSRIVAFMSDIYILHSYHDNDKVRMITYEKGIEKEFYIK